MEPKPSLAERIKTFLFGTALNPFDRNVYHRLSLVAFFAWVGLGADGLSSSCYGPEEAFLALNGHIYLSIFVGLCSVLTIFMISASYSQLIELFPTGGGGYLVASKLLNPTLGMISGCALIIDYILTITISIASGADALFSFLPGQWYHFKLEFAFCGIILLMILNSRGVKESVVPLVPIFLIFVITHVFFILYGIFAHIGNLPDIITSTAGDIQTAHSELGTWGMIFLILRAYSLGAGTFTGIEAVSNGLPILREPRVDTGKRTMTYMAVSLSFTVMGLIIAYLLYGVQPIAGKTLNAVLFEKIASQWAGNTGYYLVLITLVSEAAILFIAAQAGFIDGPRVLANMSLDRWFPSRFTMLSDRFVSQNGVLIMGIAGLILMFLTGGSVKYLVVLYSINVFITFVLSQLGMVRYWWKSRASNGISWRKKLLINGLGLVLCSFILISVIVLKFHEGAWLTLLLTGTLIIACFLIKKHYNQTVKLLRRLETLVLSTFSADFVPNVKPGENSEIDLKAKTAVILVNGFNGLGLHTLFNVIRLFGGIYKNFVFVQVGIIDSGNFKGAKEVERLQTKVKADIDQYVNFMKRNGFYAEGLYTVGNDVVEEVSDLAPKILQRFPQSIFFGGQLVFPHDSFFTRLLHNYTVFAMQRKFYHQGITMVVLPIRV